MKGKIGVALGVGAVGIAAVALRARKHNDVTDGRAHVTRSVTIRRTPLELYDAFTSVTNLPNFFPYLKAATIIDNKRQQWTFDVAGRTKTVDITIVDATLPLRFEWRMHDGPFDGSASFTLAPAPGARGTQARLAVGVTGPGAKAAAAFARLFGASPAQMAMETLRQFKALTEAGEIPKAVRE